MNLENNIIVTGAYTRIGRVLPKTQEGKYENGHEKQYHCNWRQYWHWP